MRRILLPIVGATIVASCSPNGGETAPVDDAQTLDLSPCIRTALELDEGRWDYVGTIARVDGGVRIYRTTSVHQATGPDQWSSRSFGGDVGGTEDTAETNTVILDGNMIVPINDGEPNTEAALRFSSCAGPDPEGRYEAEIEYKIPTGDGTFDLVKNVTWYGQNGAYFAEDHFNEEGRIVARRSGVYMPADSGVEEASESD